MSRFAVSFDFWNTLFADGKEDERLKIRLQLFRSAIEQHKAVSDDEILQVFERSYQFFVREWRDNMRTPTTAERIRFMASELHVYLPDDKVEDMSDSFGNLIFDIPPRDIPFIDQLVPQLAEKYPLGIISDTGYISGRHIRRFLDEKNLLSYFNSLIFSDENSNSKPHESVFRTASHQLNVPVTRLIHIGDLERTDIAGAKAAGSCSIKYIGAKFDGQIETQANMVLEDFEALPSRLEQLTRIRG